MSSNQVSAIRLAILASGAFPRLEQTPLDPRPSYPANPIPAGSGGYDLNGATRAQVTVALQQDASRRQAWISFATVDLAADYELEINGETVTYDAGAGTPADVVELVEQWAAELNADTDMAAVILASVDPDDDEVLLIQWRIAGGPIALTVSGTTAAVTLTTEYSDASILLYGRSSATVALADEAEATIARERLGSWQAHWVDGVRAAWNITDGNGFRMDVKTEGLAGLLPIVGLLVGVSGDAATGGASATLAYTAPWACVAPCTVE